MRTLIDNLSQLYMTLLIMQILKELEMFRARDVFFSYKHAQNHLAVDMAKTIFETHTDKGKTHTHTHVPIKNQKST